MTENPQKLAEQIANLFFEQQGEREANDFASLRRSIEQINERLFKIESSLSLNNPQTDVRASYPAHPSEEKFEAADFYFADKNGATRETEQPCPFEPTGKPCDHCSMCSARGF